MAEERIVVWNLQVPKPLDDAVERMVKCNMHLTKAEFIRDAVRKFLDEIAEKNK